jgi:dTDP-4-dehydrorhamnose reductase
MKTLITGSTGRLGRELIKILPSVLNPTHRDLDIIDGEGVFQYIKENEPDILIHSAALTSIRQCEENKELAWKINVEGTENLVNACLKIKKPVYFVYISTASVFFGDKSNYTEIDIPHPINFYSLTKLLSEFVVKHSILKKWLIIRTNFAPREKWPYPKAFTDRYGTYLFADDLALAIKSIIKEEITGILHICGEKKMSMFELAKIYTPDIEPMTLDEYEGPPLTKDMSLNSIRIKPFKIRRNLPTTKGGFVYV